MNLITCARKRASTRRPRGCNMAAHFMRSLSFVLIFISWLSTQLLSSPARRSLSRPSAELASCDVAQHSHQQLQAIGKKNKTREKENKFGMGKNENKEKATTKQNDERLVCMQKLFVVTSISCTDPLLVYFHDARSTKGRQLTSQHSLTSLTDPLPLYRSNSICLALNFSSKNWPK